MLLNPECLGILLRNLEFLYSSRKMKLFTTSFTCSIHIISNAWVQVLEFWDFSIPRNLVLTIFCGKHFHDKVAKWNIQKSWKSQGLWNTMKFAHWVCDLYKLWTCLGKDEKVRVHLVGCKMPVIFGSVLKGKLFPSKNCVNLFDVDSIRASWTTFIGSDG